MGNVFVAIVGQINLFPDGRPLDLAEGPDGALYVADYADGAIYRITYWRQSARRR